MRKFYQDYSLIGVVLIFCTLGLGLMFRLTGLQDTSAWGDEIASLFYAQNLSQIFHHESHTPLYYVICKGWMLLFGESIHALRYLFVSLSFFLLILTSWLLLKHRQTGMFLFFVVLWWLWPTDVIFSRQARHYGLYAELSFFYIIFWQYRESFSGKVKFSVGAFIQFLHPFTLILVWFLGLFEFSKKRIPKSGLVLTLASSLPVILYYLARFLSQGQTKVMSNISWINDGVGAYLESLLLLFAGDSYPLNQFYPLSVLTSVLFLCFIVSLLLIKSKKPQALLKFAAIMILSFLLTEIVSRTFSNVRVARYMLFLVPFFLYGLIKAVDENQVRFNTIKATILMVFLASYHLFVFRPWSTFPWDDQNVSAAKELLKTLPERELVVCGNRYQLDYYFKKPNHTCSQVALSLLREKKPFYFFDINGTEKILGAYLLQEGEITFLKRIHHATFLTIGPPR